MTVARVDNIDPIKDFRVYLTKFQEAAGQALGDADSDVQRTQTWLEGEQQTFWTGQIRKRKEILARAEDAFRQKRLYKDASGSMASAVEEQKAVLVAKKNLAEAEQKLVNVKKWNQRLQKELVLYRGGVARFNNDVSAGIPAAIANLAGTIENLEKYMDIGVGASAGEGEMVGAGAGGAAESGGATMSRGTEGEAIAAGAKKKEVDPAAIRSWTPTEALLADSKLLSLGPVELACGVVSPEHRAAAWALGGELLGDEALVAIDPAATGVSRVYLLALPVSTGFAWCVGAVDGGQPGGYNRTTVGDLKAGRPDLVELLKLPPNFMAVLDADGLVAVYNPNNENLLR
jgi:hypothetical protein